MMVCLQCARRTLKSGNGWAETSENITVVSGLKLGVTCHVAAAVLALVARCRTGCMFHFSLFQLLITQSDRSISACAFVIIPTNPTSTQRVSEGGCWRRFIFKLMNRKPGKSSSTRFSASVFVFWRSVLFSCVSACRPGSPRRNKHHFHPAFVLELRRLRAARPLWAGGVQHLHDHHCGQQYLPSHSVSWPTSLTHWDAVSACFQLTKWSAVSSTCDCIFLLFGIFSCL